MAYSQRITRPQIPAKLKRVKVVKEIMTYPVLMTPAIEIDEEAVFSGKVPERSGLIAEIKNKLQPRLGSFC
ncbi:thioredoxin family protein [Dehalogenimonas alkenigignens]|uniref:thioredoxin family protein n=1 Tax=Dehalogenimonas alkenigignens TaxID=1217799 RepID=UPI000D57DE6D|nr:thioredoxin family protein [Dehalogenimonas alkenigignens]PVV85267.1 hypothetical protein DD509_02660 [Dehalogenimonas alkenigignens]